MSEEPPHVFGTHGSQCSAEGLAGPEEVEAVHNVPAAGAFVRARKPIEKRANGTVANRNIEVVEENGVRSDMIHPISEEQVERLVALGWALSSIRVRMLGMMAEGRSCCDLPDVGVPVSEVDEDTGICVCEFEDNFEMGQSKVSYHVRKRKEAGLVREQKRGKWSYYSLNRDAAGDLLVKPRTTWE